MKKITALLLVLAAAVPLFAGCHAKNDDSNTLTIFMGVFDQPQIMLKLREKFPDIRFVVEEYAGANTSFYQRKELERGEGGDIFYYTTFYNSAEAPKYLVDLSGYSFLSNYDKALLSTLDVNGAIYQIPGPISVRYMVLNKTLFLEKGWNIPSNFDELVAVCKQIRQDTPEIAPIGLGCYAMGFVFTLLTSYAQMGYLDTAKGQEAVQKFLTGEGSFGDAFGEGLDMVSELVDAGAFMPERFENVWDITPGDMCSRNAAMGFVMNPSMEQTKLLNGECKGNADYGAYNSDEFIALPMFGRSASNKGLIMGASNTWGISKYLEQKGNEKKLANALRVLEYISSEEGQFAIRTNPAAIPALKNPDEDRIAPFMSELWNDPTNSIKDFFYYTGYEHIMVEVAQIVYDAMTAGDSTGMKENVIELADRLNSETLRQSTSSSSFGYAKEDFDFAQTRWISCEALRFATGADIAVATEAGTANGIFNNNGFAGRLFKGDITLETIYVLYRQKNADVVSVELTGREVYTLLQNGKTVLGEKGEKAVFPYWVSGVEITRKDGKITNITVNGNPIDENALYKVAMLGGDCSESFIGSHTPVSSGMNITDALIQYVRAQGVVEGKSE